MTDGEGTSGDPTDAFDLLADETRLAILRALAEELALHPDGEPVSFADLREAVGVRDSGRFNYHLGQLQDRFVRKAEDGYRLSWAGWEIVTGVQAGTYADHEEREGVEPCTVCGEPAETAYRDGLVRSHCPNDHRVRAPLPPAAAADRSLSAVVSAAMLRVRQKVELAAAGTCSECHGRLGEPRLVRPPEDGAIATGVEGEDRDEEGNDGDGPQRGSWARSCESCGVEFRLPPGLVAWQHPEVIAFHHDHGVDLLADGVVGRDWTRRPGRVVSEDPARLELTIPAPDGGEELLVTLDDSFGVVATERRAV